VDIETWSVLSDYMRPWVVYRWDVQADRIQEVDRLAEMILTDRNPAAALPILQQTLADLNSVAEPVDVDRYTCLLGLAYELSGDAPHAVQTYLQLWRDYPGSPYALIARAKLEPIP
jgi:hypothetical protein